MNERERRMAMLREMDKNDEIAKTMRFARRWPFYLLAFAGLMFLGMYLWIRFIIF